MLEIKNLEFSYPQGNGFRMNKINFRVKRGEMVSIAGPNGAGKTTLVKVMSGLIDNYSGDVLVNGKDIKSLKPVERAKLIAYIPQSESYIFDFTVHGLVSMGRRPYTGPAGMLSRKDRDIIDSAIEETGLAGKKDRKFSTLSGGEKRAVLIARAVAQQADAVIMDEPSAYLDMGRQSSLMEWVRALNNRSKAVVFVTHSVNLASEYINRIVFMKNGGIISSGTPEEVITEKNLKDIYGIKNIEVRKNEKTGRPNVFLVPSESQDS